MVDILMRRVKKGLAEEVTLELDLKTKDSRFTVAKGTESRVREQQIQRS